MLQNLSTAAATLMEKFDSLREVAGGDTSASKFLSDVPNITYPGDLCCTFYDYQNYGGEQHTACLPKGASSYTYNPGEFGHRLSSYECGKNVRFEYHNSHYP